MTRYIPIHVDAPTKPVMGQPCNGCGVCCLMEPCPLGSALSRRRHGACVALQWESGQSRYRCGVVAQAQSWVPKWMQSPGWGDKVGRVWASCLRVVAHRWIAAGKGCDSDAELECDEQDLQ